jgi:hypothetical protein
MASESLAVLRANVPSFQRFDPTMQPLLLLRAGAFCYAAADVATCTVADNAHTMAPGAGRSRVGPGANHLARRWPHCTVQDSLSRQGFPNSHRDWRERRGCVADVQSDQQQPAVAELRIMSRESDGSHCRLQHQDPGTPMTPASSLRDPTTAAQFNCEQGDS